MFRSTSAVLLLSLLGLLLPALAVGTVSVPAVQPISMVGLQDDAEILKEFKKYFRKYKDPVQRVEAVMALEDVENPKVVPVLIKLLKDKDISVRQTAIHVLATFGTRAPIDALLLRLGEEKKSNLRTGMLQAIALGRYHHDGVATSECLTDKDWHVRRAALTVLGNLKNAELVPLMVPLASDKESGVRTACLDALAYMGAKQVLPLAQASLVDDIWQVRSSAIHALGMVRDLSSLPLLIDRMEVEEGRLIVDLSISLDQLTGRGPIKNPATWRSFWNAYGGRYQLPSPETLAKLIAKREASALLYKPKQGTSYHGVDTPSRSILFVIDVSGSMEDEVTEKERFKDGNYPSYSRMDITKTELARTISGLESYVKFNILSFATNVKPWKKGLVSANVLNKSSAENWIKSLEPIGGNSKQELAAVGFGATAAIGLGKTNTWGALATALSIPVDPSAKAPKKDPYRVDVDTVFFLSDGRPTTGYYVKTEAILAGILEGNELRKVVIHTIAIGEFDKQFMKRLAKGTGGVFVDLGR
ncbi:MAG: HEAT repeat domain-containing protein [Planctomycetes bacterium]|nr:HEAT repeat domain-containing protein [Planctomycetota bacterium]